MNHDYQPSPRTHWLALFIALFVFASLVYGPSLDMPFIGDDYVFLDHVLDASFAEVWSRENVHFGWYRPWSREFHFWSIERVAGLSETSFRVVAIIIWVCSLLFFALIAGRIAGYRVGAIATLGAATLAFWGTPLLWISGSQDLWMLFFALGSILLFVLGRRLLSAVALVGALLSKETAGVLPLILVGYCLLIERRRVVDALWRTSHLWAITLAWLVFHPTLIGRLIHPGTVDAELEAHRLPAHLVLVKSALALVNLDLVPNPVGATAADVLRIALSAAVIGLAAAWSLRVTRNQSSDAAPSNEVSRWGLWWTVAGWLPLLMPSVGWHAYYACLGSLGACLAGAIWLSKQPRAALIILVILSLIRGAHAKTPSWDWGNEWYQRRAGNILAGIRSQIIQQRPTLAPHTGVYFGHIPNNIGLVAGQSPAIRVWYRDSTLKAGFYSSYSPRRRDEPPGTDLFFRFDTLAGLIEVKAGPENVRTGISTNPGWESDHERLAMLFLRSGDAEHAGMEFQKLSELAHRSDAGVFASVCWEVAGFPGRADSLLDVAQSRTGLSLSELRHWTDKLKAAMPRRPSK